MVFSLSFLSLFYQQTHDQKQSSRDQIFHFILIKVIKLYCEPLRCNNIQRTFDEMLCFTERVFFLIYFVTTAVKRVNLTELYLYYLDCQNQLTGGTEQQCCDWLIADKHPSLSTCNIVPTLLASVILYCFVPNIKTVLSEFRNKIRVTYPHRFCT